MHNISRRDAQSQGKPTYFTGTVCKEGHIAERYVSNRWCVTCAALAAKKESSKRNRQKYKASAKGKQTRKNYVQSSEGREVMRRWRTSPNGKISNRKSHLKFYYQLTLTDFETMLKTQNSSCAICFARQPGGQRDWHVDHDHKTGKVRGLLCHNCNVMLGCARDTVQHLMSAIVYLRKFSRQPSSKSSK